MAGDGSQDIAGEPPPARLAPDGLLRRPLTEAAVFWLWLVAVACAWDFGVFSLPATGWGVVGLQVAGYGVAVAPVVLWAPGTLRTLAMPWRQALAGAALVGAAIAYAASTQHEGAAVLAETVTEYLATGIGEELAFRGFLWQRMRSAGLRGAALIVANVAAFVAWHLPSVGAGLSQASDLIGVAGFGLVFAAVRLWSGNTGLPALVHIAADVAGV